MLNIEKFFNDLKEMEAIDFCFALHCGKLEPCVGQCEVCQFSGKSGCHKESKDWLFSEYKEPEVDWSKVKVDTPILVSNYKGYDWVKRYFAKFEDGKIYVWTNGGTSWTKDSVMVWKYAKLAEVSRK